MPDKILYLTPSATLLGARRSLLILLERLNKSKYTPIVLCSKEGSLVEELKKRKIRTEILRFHGWRKLRNILYIPSTIISLVRLVKKEKVSLIHCNEFWLNPYGAITAKITNIPCITHIRISIEKEKVSHYYLKSAHRLIAVSDFIRQSFNEFPPVKNKTITIYNGVDIDRFNPYLSGDEIRKEFNISRADIVVGITGQFSPRKGQRILLEAAAILLQKNKKLKFIIVGEATKKHYEYEVELKKLAEDSNLKSNVIFTGFREDIPEILSAMDIFVLPSLKEGFSRSIIEAMACGKPVIATKIGGNSEAIVDEITGFLIPPNDPQILAKRILELVDNIDRMHKMGENGRKRVAENFTVEQYVDNVEKVYKEILEIK